MGRDFETLAREYAASIYTYARYSLRDAADAEDVTQEALVRLWKHHDSVEPDRMRAWVMRTARNLVIDVTRRRRARTAIIAHGADAEAAAAVVASPDQADSGVYRGELREMIEHAIAQLNEPYRSILVMREIQGLGYDEIAAGMSMPLGTIKVYLHRARRTLREAVRLEMGNDV